MAAGALFVLSGGVGLLRFPDFYTRIHAVGVTDSAGAVTDSYDYDGWGNVVTSTGTTPNSRLYAGEELDPDLGLINLRARQYEPQVGRFSTLDPAMGDARIPVSFNR